MPHRITSLVLALILVAASGDSAHAGDPNVAPGAILSISPSIAADTLDVGACGDGTLDAGEACDDGNTTSGDCCSATCALEAAGAACGDDGLACTVDACDGAGACLHTDDDALCDDGSPCSSDTCAAGVCVHQPVAAGTTCRPSTDVCDVAEACDGIGTTCPADGFLPAAVPCRSATGECDLAESCSGAAAACPANGFASAGTACTDDGLACTTDACNGAGACTHAAGNAGAICRNAAGICDVAEVCNGTSTTCPVNALRPASYSCRAAAGECDVAEHCTGASAACPADAFGSPSTACTADANPCTSDRCDGSGACTHPPGNAGTVCRASTATCDVAETCDGSSVVCPADSGEPDTDGDAACDAQDPCTNLGAGQDFKPRPKPRIGLRRINDNVIPGDDQLKILGTFDLAVGQTFAALDPARTGARVLLLNASGGTEIDVELPAGTYRGPGTRGWETNVARSRWTYTDKTSDGSLPGTHGGIYQLRLQDRSQRTPREVQVKVSGRFGTYPVLTADSPVRAIVVLGGRSAAIAGLCGESDFVATECRFNGLRTALDCRR